MSTVGFGDMSAHNSWERFITTWIMLIGVAVYTVMLGAVTALLQNRQLGERVFEEKMAQPPELFILRLRENVIKHECSNTYLE